jgi:hypothetical protein
MLKPRVFTLDGNTVAILPIQDALAKGSAFTPIFFFLPEATQLQQQVHSLDILLPL